MQSYKINPLYMSPIVTKKSVVIKDLLESCKQIKHDVKKLESKLKSSAPKEALDVSAKILKFHVDRLIDNKEKKGRLIVKTSGGRAVASIKDVKP